MTDDASKILRLLLPIKPEFEFEAQFDTQAEINAYKSGFEDCKEKILTLFKHRFHPSESRNCSVCGEDIRNEIHFRHE